MSVTEAMSLFPGNIMVYKCLSTPACLSAAFIAI
jgi:hypothetical protein